MGKIDPAMRLSWHRAGDRELRRRQGRDSTEEETEPRAGAKRSFTLTDEKDFEECRDGSSFPVRMYYGGLGQKCRCLSNH